MDLGFVLKKTHEKRNRILFKKKHSVTQLQYPDRFTYVDDPRVEHVDVFYKGTRVIAADMRKNLNMR